MPEYRYKGFKIHYEVHAHTQKVHRAKAYVVSYKDKKVPELTQQFQTESQDYSEAYHKIKNLIEEYIDFECRQFQSMRHEKP